MKETVKNGTNCPKLLTEELRQRASFRIYPSVKALKGTCVSCREEYLAYLQEHAIKMTKVTNKVAELKEDGSEEALKQAQEEKLKLPTIMPMSNLPDGMAKTAENAALYANGKVFIDCDNVIVVDSLAARLSEDPQVLFAQISASGKGLHVVIKQTVADIAEQQKMFAEEYGLGQYLDECCKDVSRKMYLCPQDHIIKITDEFFSYFNPVKEEQPVVEELEEADFEEIEAESEPAADTMVSEDEIRRTVQQLYEKEGLPVEGNRNNTLYKVAIDLRYIYKNVTAKQLLPVFTSGFSYGLDSKEIENTLKSACKKELSGTAPVAVLSLQADSSQWMTTEENEHWLQRLEAINLPKGLHEAVYGVQRHKRMAQLLTVLPAFYTMATGISWQDQYEKKWRRLNGITIIANEMGGGKQQLYEMAELVISPLREQDEKLHEMINEFKDELTANGQKLKRGKKVPHLPIRVCGDKFSQNRILDHLASNKTTVKDPLGRDVTMYKHLYISSSDASYLGDQAKKQFTGLKDASLLSFDNEPIQSDYVSSTSVSGSYPCMINWLFAMNQKAFMSYIYQTGLEHGLATRVMIALFPHEDDAEFQKLKNSTKAIITDVARKLQDCTAWVDAESITKPLNDKLKELKALHKDDSTLNVGTHRPYNQIGPCAGVLSAVMRNLDNWDSITTFCKNPEEIEIDQEWFHNITITQDDIDLGMLVADYSYTQYCKLFYYPLLHSKAKSKGCTKLYTPTISPNTRDWSVARLDKLPQSFTTEEAKKILNFEGNLQQWLHREAEHKGTLRQISTYRWEKV